MPDDRLFRVNLAQSRNLMENLRQPKTFRPSCLCGHGESCPECAVGSPAPRLRALLRRVVDIFEPEYSATPGCSPANRLLAEIRKELGDA